LPTLGHVWQTLSGVMLAASAAGVTSGHDFSTAVSHRAIVRHVVLVHSGRCLKHDTVGAIRIKHGAEGSERLNMPCMEKIMHTATAREISCVSVHSIINIRQNTVAFVFANVC
jgi:hypothetical protein